ncbi:MAG TPA: hypothetical protein VLX12_11680 [Syntrophorhabdales bacterium]|nr:hypothetical protein [Syntrophorhabdales bacterium]
MARQVRVYTSAAVSGAMAGVSEEFTATVEADAKRTADDIVKKLTEFFAVQGWMQVSAGVRRRSDDQG